MGRFRSQYRCYSVAMYGGSYREDVDNGGKSKYTRWFTQTLSHYLSVIMPPSALDQLSECTILFNSSHMMPRISST